MNNTQEFSPTDLKETYLLESNIDLRISFFAFSEVSDQWWCESEGVTTQFVFFNFRKRFVISKW